MSVAPPPSTSGLDLYTVATPNVVKVTLALDELKVAGVLVKWTEHLIAFAANEQKEPWFLKINPNGRIPALVDVDRKGIAVWESGSILLCLAKYYDKTFVLHFEDEDEETEMARRTRTDDGPGRTLRLRRARELQYAAQRFINESKRLLQVYEDRLASRDFLLGAGRGKYSYADIVTVTWARASHFSLGVPHLSEAGFPRVQK